MLIGHFGVALGLKRFVPRMNLLWIALAANFLDLLIWPLVLLGIEKVTIPPDYEQRRYLFYEFPYSHSLFAVLVYTALFAFLGHLFSQGKRAAAGLTLAAAVLSHFILDWLVHPHDIPLTNNQSSKVGIGLWDQIWLASIIEFLILLVGLALYYSYTRPKDKLGKYGPVALFIVIAAVSLAGQLFGARPPSVETVAASGLGLLVVVIALAGWFDTHRSPRRSTTSQ